MTVAANRLGRRIHLRAGSYCLQAVFTKDLSYKYGRYLEGGKTPRKHPEEREWCVVGFFDFLKFIRFGSLDDITEHEAYRGPEDPAEDTRRLLLVPLADLDPTESVLRGLLDPTPTEHPLLVLTRITLSPTAYEFGEDERLGFVLRAIANLVTLLETARADNPTFPPVAYFGSLSSPDLVTVALPKNPEQLHAVHTFARLARTLRLAELREGRFWTDPAKERESRAAKECPGHACVMVTPTLAFQLGAATKAFADSVFRGSEEKHGLRLDFQLRTDCGHESQVVRAIRQLCGSDVVFDSPNVVVPVEQPWAGLGADDGQRVAPSGVRAVPIVTTWDTHLVRGRFLHLEALANTWREQWFNNGRPDSWRSLNLLDSVTSVSMGDDVAGWPQEHANWVIAQPVKEELGRIEAQLEKFADEFLNPVQRSEVRSVFNGFHSCFFRQDLLGTARDLFPFFSQLGHMLGDIPHWHQYLDLDPNGGREEKARSVDSWTLFLEGLDELITHVNRAVRNRIEHRSTGGNPPFPQTLRAGACKVISAYSFVVHLCFELLRRSNKDKDPGRSFCDASHFAACVHAGAQGKVEVTEIFEDFREFVQDAPPAPLVRRESEEEKKGEWPPRLFVLEIPPQSLLRPEVAIVHCLHETSEVSGWILLDRCSTLRQALNRWLINEAINLFQRRCAEQSCRNPGQEDDPPRAELGRALPCFKTFATNFVPYCLAKYDNAPARNGDDVRHYADELTRTSHPTAFADKLIEAIYTIGAIHENLTLFAVAMESSIREEERPLRPWGCTQWCPEIATEEHFQRQLETLRDLACELIGDIGMYCSLYALLTPQGESMSPEQRFHHLLKTYRSIFLVAQDAIPTDHLGGRLRRFVLHRFAVQAAAVLPAGANVEAEILARLDDLGPGLSRETAQGCLRDCLAWTALFDQECGLVASLRTFVAYGGSDDLEFLRFPAGEDADQIVRGFRDAWNEPRVDARLNRLLTLWAASNRSAIGRLFWNKNLTKEGENCG